MSERLKVVLELDDNGFVSGISANTQKLKAFGKGVIALNGELARSEKQTASWGTRLKDTALTLASLNYLIPALGNVLFGWQKQIITANAELEQSVAIMKNFSTEVTDLGAELEARNFVDMIIQKAAQAPFSINALTDSIVKMKAAGLDNAEQGFNALVDSVAAFGGTDVTLKRASVAISQMSGKGVVSMEELRQQLGEAVPNAINLMATGLSTTYSELVSQISKGVVRSDIALVAMFEEMERQMGGSALRMMETWNGLMAQLSTGVTINMQVFGEQEYFETIKELVRDIIILLNDNKTQLFFADMASALDDAVKGLRQGAEFAFKYKEEIALLLASYLAWSKGVSPVMSKMTANWSKLSTEIKKNKDVATKAAQAERTRIMSSDAIYLKHYKAIRAEETKLNAQRMAAGKMIKLNSANTMIALATERQALQASASAHKVYSASVKASSVSLKLMRGALAGLPGILMSVAEIVATGFLVKWMTGWGEAKKVVDENIESLKKYKGLYADAKMLRDGKLRLEQLKEERAELEKRAKVSEATLAQLRKDLEAANQKEYNMNEVEAIKAKIADLLTIDQQLKDADQSIREWGKVLETAAIESVEDVYSNSSLRLNKKITEALSDAQRAYSNAVKKAQADMKEVLNNRNSTEDEKKQAQAQADGIISEAANRQVAERIKVTQRYADELAETIETMKTQKVDGKLLASDDAELVGQQKLLKETLALIEKLRDPGERPALLDALIGPKKAEQADKEVENFVSMIERKILSLRGDLAEFENVTSTSGGAFEKFLASISDKNRKLPQVQENLATIKDLMEQTYANENFDKAEGDFDKFIAKLNETRVATETAFSEKSSDSLMISTKNATKYGLAMKELVKDINQYVAVKDAEKAAEMIAELERGESVAQMQDLSALYTEIANKNLKVSQQLGRQTEGQAAYYDGLIANASKLLDSIEGEGAAYEKTTSLLSEYIANLRLLKEAKGEASNVILDHVKDWGDLESAIGNAKTNALDGFVDVMTNNLTGAASGFKAFADSVIKEITRMIVKFMVMKAITGMFGGSDSMSGSGAADVGAVGAGASAGSLGGVGSLSKFANGGIMSSVGSLPLKKYANGGIASSPQLALYGEGRMNEAYVPLPDGRTIPVTMTGGGSGSSDVQVNIINQGGQQVEGSAKSSFDGEKMVVDVMLKHINQPGRVRESLKGV